MAEKTEASPTLLLLIAAAVLFFAFRGKSEPAKPDPDNPGPVEPDKPDTAWQQPNDQQLWEALAVAVERKAIGGLLQQHTDHLCKVVDVLKDQGGLADDSRVSEWRKKRVEITDQNRQQIADKLRGK